ncbi:MAG TPA: hypothetical protein VNX46_13920, partial [Candidatus Acidoferrum sp.]|nr:hypothetical protein [Candidatus Acidoferrum sp.]
QSQQYYINAAAWIESAHRCLDQIVVPDTRMHGGTERFWEDQYDIITTPNFLCSPHGWSAWNIYGRWYLYQLTGNVEYLRQAMDALGACTQLIDPASGDLRWAFCTDPFIQATVFVDNPANTNPQTQGMTTNEIVGEQYMPMISGWCLAPYGTQVSAWAGNDGGCNDNDVHEIFKCLTEVGLTSAYLVVNTNGGFETWNCTASQTNGVIFVTPAESVVNRVNVNAPNGTNVCVLSNNNTPQIYHVTGMAWISPVVNSDGVIPGTVAPAAYTVTNANTYTVTNSQNLTLFDQSVWWIGQNFQSNSPSTTLYYRFSMEFNALGGASAANTTYAALELYNQGAEVFGIGDNWPSANWSCFGHGGYFDLNPVTSIQTNQWHTFVAKIVFNQNANDNVTIYMDPHFGQPEASQSNSIVTTASFNASFDSVVLRCGNTPASATYSNIIFGATATAVGFAPLVPTPTGLSAVATNSTVSLSWNSSLGATSYNVKRSTSSGGEVTITNVSGTSYTDAGLTNGATYYYDVSTVNASGESANSSEVNVTLFNGIIPSSVAQGPYIVAYGDDLPLYDQSAWWIGQNFQTNSPSTTLYYRFSMKFNALGGASAANTTYAGLELYNKGAEVFGIGDNWPSGNWSCFGNVYFDLNPVTVIQTNQWHTFVAKIVYNQNTNDNVTIYMDPNFNLPEASQFNSIVTTASFNASFDSVVLRCGSTPASATYSNIIFGATATAVGFAQFTPPPAQNVITNGSFETVTPSQSGDNYTTPWGSLPTNGVAGWTFVGSGGDSYDGIAHGTGGLLQGAGAENGTNACFIQGTGSISQAVTLSAGTYALTFYSMGRIATGTAEPIAVSIAGLLVTNTPSNIAQSVTNDW